MITIVQLMLGWLSLFQNDRFIVTHISGHPVTRFDKVTQKSETLREGMKISLSDSVTSSYPDAYISLLNPSSGTIVANAKSALMKSRKKGNELVMALKDMVPTNNNLMLATRGGDDVFMNLSALIDWFQKDPVRKHLSAIDAYRINLNAATFFNRSTLYFYIRYHYQGTTINKQLSFKEPSAADGLLQVLIDSSVFMLNGKPIDRMQTSDIKLYYYDAAAKESVLVADEMQVELISRAGLLRELLDISRVLQRERAERAQIKALLRDHLLATYGTEDEGLIEQVVKQLRG